MLKLLPWAGGPWWSFEWGVDSLKGKEEPQADRAAIRVHINRIALPGDRHRPADHPIPFDCSWLGECLGPYFLALLCQPHLRCALPGVRHVITGRRSGRSPMHEHGDGR